MPFIYCCDYSQAYLNPHNILLGMERPLVDNSIRRGVVVHHTSRAEETDKSLLFKLGRAKDLRVCLMSRVTLLVNVSAPAGVVFNNNA